MEEVGEPAVAHKFATSLIACLSNLIPAAGGKHDFACRRRFAFGFRCLPLSWSLVIKPDLRAGVHETNAGVVIVSQTQVVHLGLPKFAFPIHFHIYGCASCPYSLA